MNRADGGIRAWLRAAPAPVRVALLGVTAIAAGIALGVGAAALLEGDDSTGTTIAKPGTPRYQPPVGGTAPQPTPGEDIDPQRDRGALPPEVAAYRPKKGFRADEDGVRMLFRKTLGGRGRGGLNKNHLVDVRCADGACLIEYIPDGPGAGRVLEAQGPLWRGLLVDPRWRRATVVALRGGPDVYAFESQREAAAAKRPAKAGPPVVRMTCSRDDVAKVGRWGADAAAKAAGVCEIAATSVAGR